MPTETTRSKGLRKFIPQPDRFAERYGRFTLTARDLSILDLVYRYRFVEAQHVRALIGGSDQQITRRLQGLFHNGYLGRYARRERMRLELDPGAPLIAYGLELKGARALERLHPGSAEPRAVRWKKEYTRRTEWFLDHHLMVSRFRCVLDTSARRMENAELVRWTQGLATWFSVNAQGRVLRVAPDAHFTLRVGAEEIEFFLEADRGTESHRRIRDKFVAYWWYLQRDRGLRAGAGQRTTVLFLTHSIERAKRLKEVLRQMPKPNRSTHGGKGVFVFLHEPALGASPQELIQELRLGLV